MVDPAPMRIIFRPPALVGGSFFPGLATPFEIDTTTLDESEKQKLDALVENADFFNQPSRVESAGAERLRDAAETTITIESAGRSHTVVIHGPLLAEKNEALRQLVRFLEAKVRERRARRP